MDLFPKYIIETNDELGNCLILGKCSFHKELATNIDLVRGGGSYKVDLENKIFTFYGESFDFGMASLEDVKKAVLEDKVFTNPYLTHSIAKQFKFKYDIGSEIIDLN